MRVLVYQLVLLVLTAPVLCAQQEAGAQEAQQQVQTEQSQQQAQALVPVQVLGQAVSFQPGLERSNVLVGGISVSGAYDDNAVGNGVSDILTNVAPFVELQQARSHMQWALSYRPGYSFYRRFSERNLYNQYFGGTFSYKFSPRLQLNLRQEYGISNDPFQSISGNQFMNAQGGFSSLNASAIVANAKRTTILSNADISYRLSEHSTLGVTGTFNKLDYGALDSTQPSQQLQGSTTTSGSMFYSHQFSASRTAGVQYEYTDLRQDQYATHARVQRLMLFHEFVFGTKGTLTLFAGPEYTQSRSVEPLNGPAAPSVAVSTTGLTPAIGVTYAWTTRQNGLRLEYMRRVTNGSNIVSAAETNSGSAAFFRQVTPRLSAQAGVTVNDDYTNSLNLIAEPTSLRTLTASVLLQRELSRYLSFSIGYTRAWQDSTGTTIAISDHSRVEVSLSYHFQRPVGR